MEPPQLEQFQLVVETVETAEILALTQGLGVAEALELAAT
jgi:hypothetical protein